WRVSSRRCGRGRLPTPRRAQRRPPGKHRSTARSSRTRSSSMALENWNIDVVHSTVGFTVRHLMVSKVHGFFTKWNGKLAFDEQNPSASHAEAQIEVASVDTREPQRDGHLRTGDFFEAEKYPYITFKSTKVERVSGEKFKVTGD